MPEIARFLGIVIRMHFNDHGPPHFHAHHGPDEAVVRLAPLCVMDGRLPARALSLVMEWATLHEADLLDNWRRLRAGEPATRVPPLERPMHPRASKVEVLAPYRLLVTFKDGTSGTVDCEPWLYERDTGVFAELRDPATFATVYLNHEAGVIEWPNGADVDPDTLYEEAHPRVIG